MGYAFFVFERGMIFLIAGVWMNYGRIMENRWDVSFLFLRGGEGLPRPSAPVPHIPPPPARLQFFPIPPENFAKLKFCAYFFIVYAQIQRLFFVYFMVFCLEL